MNEDIYQKKFVNKFGYWPQRLIYNDIDVLQFAKSSRIGDDNTILLSTTKYSTSENQSKIHLGNNTWTGKGVELNILTGTQIIIKDFTTIQDYCKLIGDVIVERYCVFAPMVFVSSGNHYAVKGNPDIIRNQDYKHLNDQALLTQHSKRVHIEEDCWIGIGVFIRQGVYIGRGAVIGANAIVTKNVLPYSIVAGSNELISQRFEFNPIDEIVASKKDHIPYFYRGFLQKEDEVNLQSKFYGIFESSSAILILAQKTFREIHIEGKIAGRTRTFTLEIVLNGNKKAIVNCQTNEQGNYSQIISADKFASINKANELEDAAYTLSTNYNVFKLTNSFPAEEEKKDFEIHTFKQVV
ncbi:MAG: DapH/DapD/GlmU-related protein [Bacteroidota bacterium]